MVGVHDEPRRHQGRERAVIVPDRAPGPDSLSSLQALGYALIPWAVLAILVLILRHYAETNWFFGP